ncbi:hypothetical protein SB00610_00439 [Klebsiella quasipneumoniae subsp. similipneumoniae]|nr:hypothetical protein SB00610_00439 [Klebsiella quasipneumoniae subsp. similipneumoniae]
MFMFTEVPAPPWKTSTGNWSMHLPLFRTSSQAAIIAFAALLGMVCSSLFASAAAFFTITMPRTNSGMSLILLLLM